jgi:hypothetical protein
MDEIEAAAARSEAVISGAYGFSKNLLVASFRAMLALGADDDALEQMLQDVGNANENIPEGIAKNLADTMASHSLMLVRMMRAERAEADLPSIPGQSPPPPPECPPADR